MATPTEESRRQVIAAREELGDSLDDLTLAFRSAIDIPAKIRKNPLQTVALAGGAGFLAVGGPKKVIRAAVHRIRPSTRRPHDGLLPKDIDKVVRRKGGPRADEIETALENDFADYLKRKGKVVASEPNAGKSLWKTYDTIVGPLGSARRQAAGRPICRRRCEPTARRRAEAKPGDRQRHEVERPQPARSGPPIAGDYPRLWSIPPSTGTSAPLM